jgi:hypothetical protein
MSFRTTGNTSAQTPDINIEEMYTLCGFIIQMEHYHRHILKVYWSREEQYCTPFYSNLSSTGSLLPYSSIPSF